MDVHAIAVDYRANPITAWVVKEVQSGIELGIIKLKGTSFVAIDAMSQNQFQTLSDARDSFSNVKMN